MAAGRLRRDLEQSNEEIAKLQEEISKLNDKLRDSNNGLKAAARLSSQLEARAAQLNDMKLTGISLMRSKIRCTFIFIDHVVRL